MYDGINESFEVPGSDKKIWVVKGSVGKKIKYVFIPSNNNKEDVIFEDVDYKRMRVMFIENMTNPKRGTWKEDVSKWTEEFDPELKTTIPDNFPVDYWLVIPKK